MNSILGNFYERMHDHAGDNFTEGYFRLEEEILLAGYCIDRPSFSPAGSAEHYTFHEPVRMVFVD